MPSDIVCFKNRICSRSRACGPNRSESLESRPVQYGIPSVGYRVGGIVDWLEPGVTGELAPADPPTVRGLTEALVRILESPGHYQSLCEGAEQMGRRHNPVDHFQRLDEIMEQVIAGQCIGHRDASV